MSRNTSRTRRIFGGKESAPPTGSATYARPLNNPTDQAVAETLPVATTYRKFPGPDAARGGGPAFSIHVNPVTAAGATSTLDFYYSNLPDPDPTDATHWVASGITQIDLTSTNDTFITVADKYPAWILAKAVVANSTGTIWAYARMSGVEE